MGGRAIPTVGAARADKHARMAADLHVENFGTWRDTEGRLVVRAMGAETANLHLASSTPADLAALTTAAARRWIRATTKKMLEDTVRDWMVWRDAQPREAGRGR